VRVADDTWLAAKTRAASEGVTISHVLSLLIEGYAKGEIDVPAVAMDFRRSGPLPDTQDIIEELLETLADVINQACSGPDGELDSMALSAYADGLRVLAEHGRVRITHEAGRRVIAEWSTNHGTTP
jgi:hypothetical protein